MEPVRIGIFPARVRSARGRLFGALEAAYPVRFQGCEQGSDWGSLDGLMAFGVHTPTALPADLPCLHALGEEHSHAGPSQEVALAHADALARPLRGAHLSDCWGGSLTLALPHAGQIVLGSVEGAPAWVAVQRGESREDGVRSVVSVAPAELNDGESLRERMVPGRCLALLAVTNFLKNLSREPLCEAQPLRAAFVLDDPNLHWPSYGYVRYAELAQHAREHAYHMAVAMTPLDGWFAHPRATRIFRDNPAQLSLCIHGNNHLGPELGRVATLEQGVALARQALARAWAFQRRTGIPFERVMVPPHEQLSEPAARGLLAGGFEALCVSRPYPWIEPRSPSPAAALGAGPPQRGALAGWSPREIVAGGLPLLLRAGFNAPREDLALRAYLGQPLILYAHHNLLEHGLDVLADAASAIDALGEVRWGSLASIARNGADGAESKQSRTPDQQQMGEPLEMPRSRLRPGLRPLLRRLTSEARDRASVLVN